MLMLNLWFSRTGWLFTETGESLKVSLLLTFFCSSASVPVCFPSTSPGGVCVVAPGRSRRFPPGVHVDVPKQSCVTQGWREGWLCWDFLVCLVMLMLNQQMKHWMCVCLIFVNRFNKYYCIILWSQRKNQIMERVSKRAISKMSDLIWGESPSGNIIDQYQ